MRIGKNKSTVLFVIMLLALANIGFFPVGTHATEQEVYIVAADTTGHSNYILSYGDGTFGSQEYMGQPPQPYYSYGCGIGDFDNDGDFDYIIGTGLDTAYPHHIYLYEKLGPGNDFASPVSVDTWTEGYYPMDFAVADYDNDGNMDFVLTHFGSSNSELYLGNGDFTFTRSVLSGTSPHYSIGADSVDFDNDGNADFVAAQYGSPAIEDLPYNGSNPYYIYVNLGNGDGTFTTASFVAASGAWGSTASDFDSDGNVDIISGGLYTFGWYFYRGNGDGTFQSGVAIAGVVSEYSPIDNYDFDGDGGEDIIIGCQYSARYYSGNGDGTFTYVTAIGGGAGGYRYAISAPPLLRPIPGRPHAIASPELQVLLLEGGTASFNGSTSYDDDGWIVSYFWEFDDGDNATGPVVSHPYSAVLEKTIYRVKLTVTDNEGKKGYDTVIVRLAPPEPVLILDLDITPARATAVDYDDGIYVLGTNNGDLYVFNDAGVYTVTNLGAGPIYDVRIEKPFHADLTQARMRARASSTTILSVEPPSIVDPSLTPGSTFTVDINIANAEDLYSWGVKVQWDRDLLDVISVTEGPFLQGQPDGTAFMETIDNWLGRINIGCTTLGDWFGVWGNGTLMTVTFMVTGNGETALDIYYSVLLSYDVVEIPHTIEDGYFSNVDVTLYDLTVDSDPDEGVDFTLDGVTHTTTWNGSLLSREYTIVMPLYWMFDLGAGPVLHVFAYWDDDMSTDPTRVITVPADGDYFPAVYEEAPFYEVTVDSDPSDGVEFTLDGETYTTTWDGSLLGGEYTIVMPSRWMFDSVLYVFAYWDDDMSTDPTRVITLPADGDYFPAVYTEATHSIAVAAGTTVIELSLSSLTPQELWRTTVSGLRSVDLSEDGVYVAYLSTSNVGVISDGSIIASHSMPGYSVEYWLDATGDMEYIAVTCEPCPPGPSGTQSGVELYRFDSSSITRVWGTRLIYGYDTVEVRISENKDYVAVTTSSGTEMCLLDLATGNELPPRYNAYAEQFAVDGDDDLNYVIGGTQYHPSYGAIYKYFVLKTEAGTLTEIKQGYMDGSVNDLDSSPDATRLAFGSDAGDFIVLGRTDDTVATIFAKDGLNRIDAIELGSCTLLVGGYNFIHLYSLICRTIDKTLSTQEGYLGDVVHVKLEVTTPQTQTVEVVDTLPSEWSYINGSFTVDGVPATPTITTNRPPPPLITEVSYTITGPGTHVIEFDCKVDTAYWEDREVCNIATATWYDETGEIVDTKEDVECFIIHAFEELHKNVGIPKADVVFAIDLTGSMSDEIAQVKANATNIMNSLAAQIADVQFGLISFMDYDGYYTTYSTSTGTWYNATYGGAAWGDYPYKLDQDITNNIPVMTAQINGLTLGFGADGPQDYTRIIHEAYNDTNLHWRTGAKRILILFGDNVPHDNNFDNNNDATADNTGGDPGRDTILGTADDLDFETEVANAAAAGVHIMAVYSGWTGQKYPWMYMANQTGGGYFELEEAEQIPDAIKDLIKAQALETLTIKEKMEVQWAVVMDIVNPFSYTMKNVTIKDNFGAELEIDEVITAPDTNHDGIVDIFDLSKVGMKYGTWALVDRDEWDPVADINNDGHVDMRDLSVVAKSYGITLWLTGRSEKVHLFWYIGDLEPGETARIIILVSTDLNPAGYQEYTTPGIYEMNSGATLKFIDPEQDMQLSAVTDSIYVTVLPLEDC